MLSPRRLVAVAVAFAALLAPAAASATTVSVAPSCVRVDEQVHFQLTGAAPGLVDLLVDGSYFDTVDTGESGAFTGAFPSPSLGSVYAAAHTLSTRDGATASFAVTATGAIQVPAAPKPGGTVKLTAYGFVEGGPLYAHYVYRPTDTKRQLKKTVKLGIVTGPCGNLVKKVAALPVKRPKAGVWLVQVDARPGYRSQKAPYAELSVYVPKR